MSNSHDVIQWLTFPRTGSTHAYMKYALYAHRRNQSTILCSNFFNDNYILTENWFKQQGDTWDLNTAELGKSFSDKLRFLEEKRRQDIHISIKIMGHDNNSPSDRNMLLDYLSHYKVCTIRRDPFECFLSFLYMDKTRNVRRNADSHYTTINHGFKKSLIETMDISYENVILFKNSYARYLSIINDCDIYHTFNFENLDEELNEFFPTLPPIEKNQIDYKSLVPDLEEAKWMFESIVNE